MTIQDYDWYEAPQAAVEMFAECEAEHEVQLRAINEALEDFGAENAYGKTQICGLSFAGDPPENWRKVGTGKNDGKDVNIYLPARTSEKRRADYERITSLVRPAAQRCFGGKAGGPHMSFSGTTMTLTSPHLMLRKYLGVPKEYPPEQLAFPMNELTPVRVSDVMRAMEDHREVALATP